tara:strand:- start:227 stop:1822 length:1596 start_codon:yes stop_codon:yes gene_type:complete
LEVKKNKYLLENKRWVFSSFIFSILILLPVLVLLINFFSGDQTTLNYLFNTVLFDYSLNTFYLILLTSITALVMGIFPAWVISNYNFYGRKFFDIALYLPLAIPAYIMAFTYIDILNYTGPFQTFLRNYSFLPSDFFNVDYLQIETLGILLGLSLYPYVYTASRISFSLIGSNYINVSKNLGLSTLQTFYKVILPLSRPAIISGLFLVIMEVLNEYGAVKYFGVNTFTSGIFRSWFSLGDINGAIQLACILLIFVLLLFYLEKKSLKNSQFYYSKNSDVFSRKLKKTSKPLLAYFMCIIPFLFGFILPVLFIINNTFHTFSETNFPKLFDLIGNSIFVSTFSAIFIIAIALFLLFVNRISKIKSLSFINNLVSLGYALPGAVIGLGLILLFSSNSLVGSFLILFYAYIIRFLAVGKSPIKSSIEKQPESFDDTGKNLGLGPFKLLKQIHLPVNKYALISAFILVFIDVLKELPITLILSPFNFETLATQTYLFAVEEMLPLSSIYSLIIIVLSSVMLLILKNFIDKQLNVS